NGELFFIVDSDDTLTPNALSVVLNTYNTELKSKDIGGVSLRGCYADGMVVGNSNFKRVVCNSLDIRNVYGVTGDLVEVFTTKVMKEFPFPEIENEKFCPEVLVWNRIAQKYKLVYVNNAIYVVEYQKGGLTDRIVKIRMTSPIASMLTYSELSSYAIPIKQKIKAGINFWRFSFNSSMPFIEKLKLIGWRYLPILPLGFVYYGYDMYKHK
ncbi:MAG: glycosyltransferase family 2 protein, partial [Bacteroidia bacterium]